jgi:hypothetical protein
MQPRGPRLQPFTLATTFVRRVGRRFRDVGRIWSWLGCLGIFPFRCFLFFSSWTSGSEMALEDTGAGKEFQCRLCSMHFTAKFELLLFGL